ncbi:hypothetical protein EU78_22420 [Mycolicibacterium rufum]|nr:hypothetical protein EU78_22420 [Mycolicibacterium rufum]
MGVEQGAAEEPDHQAGRGSAEGGTDRVPAGGLADGCPASSGRSGRRRIGRRCGVPGLRRVWSFGDAVGLGGVVGVLVVHPILVRALIVGHGTSFVVGT